MRATLLFPGLALTGVLLSAARAQQSVPAESTSTSPGYALLHGPAGSAGGGGRVTNAGATITAETSTGDTLAGGVSLVSAGGVQTKGNLTGQLYDPLTVSVSAAPLTIDERGTRQITATATMDDATRLDLRGTLGAQWGYGAGIASVDVYTGIATAGSVTVNTPVIISVTYRGKRGQAGLTILEKDTPPETYGGDDIDDAWQVQYFGPAPNPAAAPDADPDGDGQSNLVEYLTGFVPTDRTSFFRLTIQGYSAPGVMDFRFNKVLPGRTYTLRASGDLVSVPRVVGAPFTVPAEGTDHLFQDPAATATRGFYYLEISVNP